MESIPSEMLRGHVDTIILLSLLPCDKHTSQIKEEIESRVDGQFELKQGTFYSCLQRIVGQGYVTEYRSSSSDGKRRKFYQLTEKGKSYIEDNKDKWLFSRNVIDTLIQVPEDTTPIDSVYSYKPKKKEQEQIIKKQETEINQLNSKIDEIKSKIEQITAKQTESETSKVTKETETVVNSDNSIEETSSKINDDDITELEKFLYENYDTPAETRYETDNDQPISETVANFVADNSHIVSEKNNSDNSQINLFESVITEVKPDEINKQSQNSQPDKEKAAQFREVTNENPRQPDLFDFIEGKNLNTDAQDDSFKNIQINGSFKRVSENCYNYQPETPRQTTFNQTQSSNVATTREIDDYYDGEQAITHDYKSVLSKLFPTKNDVFEPSQEEHHVEVSKPERQMPEEDYVEYAFNEPRVIRAEQKKHNAKLTKEIKKSIVKKEDYVSEVADVNSQTKFDFSDIFKLAETDGFKVKTSSASAHKEIGKILINKLLAGSSVSFFILIALEALLLALTTRTVSGFGWTPYLIFIAIAAIFPVISLITYFIDPRRKVDSLISFKSMMSFVFIITINLIIIIFVYSIILNVDFTNIRQLMVYVFYPLVASLNIPIYFFIKYLNLDNPRFYS